MHVIREVVMQLHVRSSAIASASTGARLWTRAIPWLAPPAIGEFKAIEIATAGCERTDKELGTPRAGELFSVKGNREERLSI